MTYDLFVCECGEWGRWEGDHGDLHGHWAPGGWHNFYCAGKRRRVEVVEVTLGEHLNCSVEQVRSWPLEMQRSQGVRGQAPPRHRPR